MNNNPFTSDTFSTIWSSHFSPAVNTVRFGFLKNLQFIKHKFLPLYINKGKTHTKGISYTAESTDTSDIKGKVLLIYDVPTYFEVTEITQNRIKTHKVKQYPGFLINVEPYKDLNEFMVGTFKKSSRYKLKKYKRKLESCFDIRYKMFYGEMSREEYDFVFEAFKKLLIKRFDDKQVANNNLNKEEWDFYYEVAHPMISEKKAGLFVIYNGNQPIGVTLNYFAEDVLFDAITVFDIDYAKFHLGSVTIMKLIEWSINQKLKVFDFSKGYFDYKKRWASMSYDFEYHIIYDSKSFSSLILASIIKNYYQIKQNLRDRKVNEKLHSLTYMLKNKSKTINGKSNYELLGPENISSDENFVQIDYNTIQNHALKTVINDFLYINNESQLNLKIYKLTHRTHEYLLQGKEKKIRIKMTFR